MKRERRNLSHYRIVWLFAMFDLPVETSAERNHYTRFRKVLLRHGFMQLQYSVYARFCGSDDKADVFRREIKKMLPPGGEVRLLAVTDRQFGQQSIFRGKKRVDPEESPPQLSLF